MAFPFLGIFIILISIFSYYRKRNTRLQQEVQENFWNREAKANDVRRQDISGLPYIIIPFERFPLGISTSEELLDYENDLKKLSNHQILNLNNQSNTDLKLKYGPANLPYLSECDQCYTTLIRTLVAYAKCLIQNGYESEAVCVLEYGIEIDSDIRDNYRILGEIYKNRGQLEKLNSLIQKAQSLDSIMQPAILNLLNEIKS